MKNQNNIISKDSETTLIAVSELQELINCRHGWECHGRKSGKCPYIHPNAKPIDINSNSNSNSNSSPQNLTNCKHGLGCHGHKSGKCPYVHPVEVLKISQVSICKNGHNYHRHKSGKCHFLH